MYRRATISVSLLLLLSSCTDFWYGSTKRQFNEACTEEAAKWTGSAEKTKLYCDCVLEKMMKKYPNDEDALAHIDILAKDTDLINCRNEIKGQK